MPRPACPRAGGGGVERRSRRRRPAWTVSRRLNGALRARLAIGELLPGLENATRVSGIENSVRTEPQAVEEAMKSAEQALAKPKALRLNFVEAESSWEAAASAFGDGDDLAELERRSDLKTRFPLFLGTTNYQECGWILPMEAELVGIVAPKGNSGKAPVIPRRHRRIMLTPCAVGTFASVLNLTLATDFP